MEQLPNDFKHGGFTAGPMNIMEVRKLASTATYKPGWDFQLKEADALPSFAWCFPRPTFIQAG